MLLDLPASEVGRASLCCWNEWTESHCCVTNCIPYIYKVIMVQVGTDAVSLICKEGVYIS